MSPVFLLLLLPAAHADCASAQDLQVLLTQAREAYISLDLPQFQADLASVRSTIQCLADPLPAGTVPLLHEVQALGAWVERSEPQMQAAFRGVLASNPDYQPDPVVAPDGGGVLAGFEAAWQAGPGSLREIPAGLLLVDGDPQTTALPLERAAYVQRPQADDRPDPAAWYLWGSELPADLSALLLTPTPGPFGAIPLPSPKVGRGEGAGGGERASGGQAREAQQKTYSHSSPSSTARPRTPSGDDSG